LKCNFFN